LRRVVHFEIPAENPDRAVKFYQTVFDWKIEKWAGPFPYWLVTTGQDNEPGINGAIMEKNSFKTTVNTIDVTSVDESLGKILAAAERSLCQKDQFRELDTLPTLRIQRGMSSEFSSQICPPSNL